MVRLTLKPGLKLKDGITLKDDIVLPKKKKRKNFLGRPIYVERENSLLGSRHLT